MFLLKQRAFSGKRGRHVRRREGLFTKAKWGSSFTEKGQGRAREEREPRPARRADLNRGKASLDTRTRKMMQIAPKKEEEAEIIISSRIMVIFLFTHTQTHFSRVYLARRVFTGDSVRQLCAVGTSTGMSHRVTGRTSSYASGLSLHHHPTPQRATTNSRPRQRLEV